MAGMTEKQWADVVNFPNTLDAEEGRQPVVTAARIVPAQRPEDIRVGGRVQEIYTDSKGTAVAIIGIQVQVRWDDHQPEDDMIPHPTFDELVPLA